MKEGRMNLSLNLVMLLIVSMGGYTDSASDGSSSVSINDILLENPACKDDVVILKDLCNKSNDELSNNWALLDCIESLPEDQGLSPQCKTTVWQFKLEVTRQDVFLNQSRILCGTEMLNECMEEKANGHLLACMVESKMKFKGVQCAQFLGQLERIIFSDWRIISSFMTECEDDVKNLKCGSVKQKEGQVHSQEDTITCLTTRISEVGGSCRKQILLIAELQADDFHLDRELFHACKADREAVCPGIQAGEGRVYHCLTQNKAKTSLPCREQLTRRQAIAAQDYKVDGSLLVSCREELEKFRCETYDGDDESVKLSTVLLCLEDNLRDGRQLGGQCVREMGEIRRSLMEDFAVTPELVNSCQPEITELCKNVADAHNGQMIHCLMKAVMDQNDGATPKRRLLSDKCEKALNALLSEVQMSSDWRADPVLEESCDTVVMAKCDPKLGGDAVMSCLMEQLAKEIPGGGVHVEGQASDSLEQHHGYNMPAECREVLLQIHYFLARDVLIDEHLYKNCKTEAEEVCEAPKGWHHKHGDSRNLLVFPCLVRNLYTDDLDDLDEEEIDNKSAMSKPGKSVLSKQCTLEVERTLRQRAMSVQLHPEVEEVCRGDLHTLCAQYNGPGQEFECLQYHYKDLREDCQKIVGQYTRVEANNPFLHPIVTKACSNLIERKCGAEFKSKDGSGVMECLIRHKLEHPSGSQGAMNNKCRTIVEHWQIITLQDWRFSPSFKEACKDDIREHCVNPRPKKKHDVVSCLVMIISNDTVMEDRHRIKKACRAELKLELLSRHSDIRMDPDLQEACKEEVSQHCSEDDIKEDGGLECLKNLKPSDISKKKCRKLLFEEEKEEAEDPEVDYTLLRSCKHEILQYCPNENADMLLHCLKDYSKETGFSQNCLSIIKKRTVQRMKDYRLNPSLRKACKQDIPKFCSSLVAGKERVTEELFEGKVIECLKERVIQKEQRLSDYCHKQMLSLMEEAAPLIAADPILEESCLLSIAQCKRRDDVKTDLQIHECLKHMFEEKDLKDGPACNRHIALVIEGASADIHVDPVLNSACSLDLKKFCRDVPQGEGKLLTCLVGASREPSFTLEPECGALLARRVHMYDMAIKVAPMDSAAELYRSVMESQHRNYFLTIGMFFLCIIFVFGLCFGRVSHRLSGEMKNR